MEGLSFIAGGILGALVGYLLSKDDDKTSLSLIIKTLNQMGEKLNEIKAELQSANEKADRIAADVTLLHEKIDNISGETPTAEEWADVKATATALNNKLQGIDEKTPEETAEPGGEEEGGEETGDTDEQP